MQIEKKEALRYMGYRGQEMDIGLQKLLDACIDEVKAVSRESFTYEIFDIERRKEGLYLKGSTLTLAGEDIKAHLLKAEKCAVMAVTLGLETDKRIALYSKTDLTKGLIFDACATTAVESLCDDVQEEIEAKAKDMGLEITTRFSPGYGDFSINIQKEIAGALKTYEKIGLGVNENSLMVPRKSVTAIIGMQKESCIAEGHKCINCEDKKCIYREDINKDE